MIALSYLDQMILARWGAVENINKKRDCSGLLHIS